MTGKHRILIIDDDERHILGTLEILRSEGYDVATHGSPFGSTHRIVEFRPDLVLLDVNMPALSGEKLVGILRGNAGTKDANIVFYSSNDEDTLRAAVVEHGVRGYICKGDPLVLRRKVAQYLR